MSGDWKIYGIYEKLTGACIYIGRTSMSLENRWFYHTWVNNKKQTPLWTHLQEKGIDKFCIELVMICKTREEWCEWEEHIILELQPRFNRKLPGIFT